MLSLGSFLDALKKQHPEDLMVIDDVVNPAEFEATAILQHLENNKKFPAVLFTRPLNLKGEVSRFPLATNICATRELCAFALGMDYSQSKMPLSLEFAKREACRIKPKIITKDKAPVKQVVLTGNDVDLREFPIVKHHYMDPAPYIDMTPVHLDPGTKAGYNAAILRMQYKGPKKLGLYMGPRHNLEMTRRYDVLNKPAPTVIVVTHHPAFHLGALNGAPYADNDYEVIGSIMNEPLRLVASETWGEDILVPADADLIIEGNVPPNTREAEGPFGEFAGYSGPQRYSHLIDVTAITHCKNAIYQDIFVGHQENWVMGAVAKEGTVFLRIQAVLPTVKGVHLANSGAGRFNCYVSIDQVIEGQAKQAGLIAMANQVNTKNVIVVDEDIDPYEEQQVMWAVGTRMQPDEDVDIIKNITGNNLDPSSRGDLLGAKMIIDATRPCGKPFEAKISIPDDAMERVKPIMRKLGITRF